MSLRGLAAVGVVLGVAWAVPVAGCRRRAEGGAPVAAQPDFALPAGV